MAKKLVRLTGSVPTSDDKSIPFAQSTKGNPLIVRASADKYLLKREVWASSIGSIEVELSVSEDGQVSYFVTEEQCNESGEIQRTVIAEGQFTGSG